MTATLLANAASPTLFAVGDGTTSSFALLPSAQSFVSAVINTLQRTDWEGTLPLYAFPRTNLIKASNDLTQSAWTTTNLTASTAGSAVTAPNATFTSLSLTDTTTNASHNAVQSVSVTATLGECVTLSCWFKVSAGQRYVQLQIDEGAGTNVCFAVFDLTAGAVVAQGTAGAGVKVFSAVEVSASAPGWYRCSVSGIVDLVSTTRRAGVFFCNSAARASAYAGTGTNAVYVWGVQFEAGAVPTTYIPTAATASASLTDYAFSPTTGIVTFPAPPGVGALLTWTGTYSYQQTVLQQSVISQYANSPKLMQLVQNLNTYFNPSALFNQFYNQVWNINTAVGYGLDVWGRILGVSRVLLVSNGGYFGLTGTGGAIAASGDALGGGPSTTPALNPLYSGQPTSGNYALTDPAYRTLLLAKALFNICNGAIPAINQVLINLFLASVPGRTGNAFCTDNLNMSMTYTFTVRPLLTPVEVAIITQSGALPKPTGVSNTLVQL